LRLSRDLSISVLWFNDEEDTAARYFSRRVIFVVARYHKFYRLTFRVTRGSCYDVASNFHVMIREKTRITITSLRFTRSFRPTLETIRIGKHSRILRARPAVHTRHVARVVLNWKIWRVTDSRTTSNENRYGERAVESRRKIEIQMSTSP